MVELMNTATFRSESDTSSSSSCRPNNNNKVIKLEFEDSLDEEHGPFNKRSKNNNFSSSFQQQWNNEGSNFSITAAPASQYNPLDEPSPLGLQLKKSPSFMDLIETRLSQGNVFTLQTGDNNLELGNKKKDVKASTSSSSSAAAADKLKASNFPASLLKIGTWECVSRYEGDLVAKCYYAKHKLVWEVLDGGLKSKMEIQWSDITALKADFPSDGPGSLDLVLARQPLFFRETNPQPRKHTLWQATSDFTGGQASVNRRHFLQCPPGLLNKNFEKLIQCDPRLNWLSRQPEIVLESPYFEPKGSIFEDPDNNKSSDLDQLTGDFVSTLSGFRDGSSPSAVQSSSTMSDLRDSAGRAPDNLSRDTPSPSSVMDPCAIEDNGSGETEHSKMPNHLNQLKVPGLHSSMSMSDLVNHIGNCISEQMTSGNPLFSDGLQNENMLDDIAQYLLSDSQHASTSDEKSLMSRVNSLCCLLQKDSTTPQNSQVNGEACVERSDDGRVSWKANSETKISSEASERGGDLNDSSAHKQVPAMSRKDSLGDLLLHLPRIASLPQFLFNIPEDDNQAR
ncbi:hypothetical protein IFM89_018085 [Coptis chinensis]|uniref:TRF2/HOY1 PH-like domain-containing protein n=1 Tax=Coptis chinensis TaxID=261450 RepID=A0A835M2T8_9MAGN|nr:hypothetical protein IFM89_018085 [Coptis chinensis]